MDKNGYFLKWHQAEKTLEEKGLKIFSLEEFLRLFNISSQRAKKFLSRQVKQKNLLRVKKGIYVLERSLPSDFLIANKIYQPSYISLETALSFYNIIPEAIYKITSVTTKPTRVFEFLEKDFIFRTIRPKAFCGYTIKQIEGENVFMALPEKALADYLYFTLIDKLGINERLFLKKISKEKVKKYLSKFSLKDKVIRRLI